MMPLIRADASAACRHALMLLRCFHTGAIFAADVFALLTYYIFRARHAADASALIDAACHGAILPPPLRHAAVLRAIVTLPCHAAAIYAALRRLLLMMHAVFMPCHADADAAAASAYAFRCYALRCCFRHAICFSPPG